MTELTDLNELDRKPSIQYGQTIEGPEGYVSIDGCSSREEAVRKIVNLAMCSNWSPPRWWQFWRRKWPADCVAEYNKRST